MSRFIKLIAVVPLVAATVSCGSVIREGRGSSFLVVDSVAGIRGAAQLGQPSSSLTSDVITNVITPAPCSAESPCPTIFGDPGQAVMHIVMKDAESTTPTTPGAMNHVTLTRYRVVYTRADGRNTPGVDVPYPWDGAATGTIQIGGSMTLAFLLVRHDAKLEAPLADLANNITILDTIAEVTFYGYDRVGNAISATGTIQIEFANFGDF